MFIAKFKPKTSVNLEGTYVISLKVHGYSIHPFIYKYFQAGGKDGPTWCKEIANMRDEVGSEVGTWFYDNIRLKVGNRASTLFWFDRWVGEVPLQVRFRRLFD